MSDHKDEIDVLLEKLEMLVERDGAKVEDITFSKQEIVILKEVALFAVRLKGFGFVAKYAFSGFLALGLAFANWDRIVAWILAWLRGE